MTRPSALRQGTDACLRPSFATDYEPEKPSETQHHSQALHTRRHPSLPVAALSATGWWQ